MNPVFFVRKIIAMHITVPILIYPNPITHMRVALKEIVPRKLFLNSPESVKTVIKELYNVLEGVFPSLSSVYTLLHSDSALPPLGATARECHIQTRDRLSGLANSDQ